jgi:hypothetical protein
MRNRKRDGEFIKIKKKTGRGGNNKKEREEG